MVNAELILFFLMSLVSCSIAQDPPKQNYNPKTDGVVELTQINFKTTVLDSDQAWLVIFEFSGADCKTCIELSQTVKKAVPLLKAKKINVGYVDYMTTEGKKLVDTYGITMFPVKFIFGSDKQNPINYEFHPSSEQELVDAVEFLLNKPPPAKGKCGKDSVANPKSNTYELTDENFEEVVLKCEEPWMINFYAPNGDLCIAFAPFFEAAAKQFNGRVKFGSFYMLGSKVAAKYGAKMMCTVKLFPAGNKNGLPVDYNNGYHGPTINTELIPWIEKNLGLSLPATTPPPSLPATTKAPGRVNELTNQGILDLKCRQPGVTSCIFLFLGKDDQCNAECKSTNVNLLTQLGNDMKGENLAWFWSSEENQQDFEQTYGIKGFPGAIGIDRKSNTYSFLKGIPKDGKLKEFIESFVGGKLSSKNLPFVDTV